MTAYEIVLEANADALEGRAISEDAKQHAAARLLMHASRREGVERLLKRGGAGSNGRHMYPMFFVPPCDRAQRYRLVTGEKPRTQLLSANHYELEILRLLALWRGDDPNVRAMLEMTITRLQSTCFAHFCAEGDCIGVGVAVLRLLSVVRPRVPEWIDQLLAPLGEIFREYRGQAAMYKNLPVWYFCLALSGIEGDAAVQIIRTRREHMLGVLRRGRLARPARDGGPYLSVESVLLRTLSRLPECAGIVSAPSRTSEQLGLRCCDYPHRQIAMAG